MCSLINKQLLLTAYAYLFIMEQQKGQQGSEALQVEKTTERKVAITSIIDFWEDCRNCQKKTKRSSEIKDYLEGWLRADTHVRDDMMSSVQLDKCLREVPVPEAYREQVMKTLEPLFVQGDLQQSQQQQENPEALKKCKYCTLDTKLSTQACVVCEGEEFTTNHVVAELIDTKQSSAELSNLPALTQEELENRLQFVKERLDQLAEQIADRGSKTAGDQGHVMELQTGPDGVNDNLGLRKALELALEKKTLEETLELRLGKRMEVGGVVTSARSLDDLQKSIYPTPDGRGEIILYTTGNAENLVKLWVTEFPSVLRKYTFEALADLYIAPCSPESGEVPRQLAVPSSKVPGQNKVLHGKSWKHHTVVGSVAYVVLKKEGAKD